MAGAVADQSLGLVVGVARSLKLPRNRRARLRKAECLPGHTILNSPPPKLKGRSSSSLSSLSLLYDLSLDHPVLTRNPFTTVNPITHYPTTLHDVLNLRALPGIYSLSDPRTPHTQPPRCLWQDLNTARLNSVTHFARRNAQNLVPIYSEPPENHR